MPNAILRAAKAAQEAAHAHAEVDLALLSERAAAIGNHVAEHGEAHLIAAMEKRRTELGLPKETFGALLDLGRNGYSEFLGGRRPLPLKAARRAFALGVPAEAILQAPAA